jgi:23S rRNA maturation mini-RNase III
MTTRLLRNLLLAGSLTAAAQAFLGITVFDPTNWAEALNQLDSMNKQHAQLVETYAKVRDQYDHMIQMAKQVPVTMATRYRALVTPWRRSSATNVSGTTGGWIGGINTGGSLLDGYLQAVERLNEYGTSLARVPADQLERLQKVYGSIELADGANLHTMETLGVMRQTSEQVETAIQDLETDSLSSDPTMNTEVAVLNKIGAASVVALRNAQDTNKLLVALAEQEVVHAKRRRDADSVAINNHIRFIAEGREYLASQKENASDAMLAYRIP